MSSLPVISPPDQATRDLVSRDGLGLTLFVEAGAGTGKTTQLVDRITNLVLEDGVRLSNIAAITFTEAAAAELQTRIRVRFETRAADAADEDERQRCLEAIADVDLAALSTLHGFASRLLSEFAIEAGLPPRVRVLDEVSSQLAHEARWERFVDALYDNPVHEDALVRAALVGIAFEPAYPGHATLKDVAAELNDNWDRLPDVPQEIPSIAPVEFCELDQAVGALVASAQDCSDPSDLYYLHLTQTLIPQIAAVVDISDPNRKLGVLHALKPWGKGRGGKDAAWDGNVKAAKALVDGVNEAVASIIGRTADDILRYLLVFIGAEVRRAAQARREDGGLEFHDLLVLAREVLRNSPEARARLHDRYTHLLLDEFQDTDPIQIELALLIAATIVDGPLPSTWQELSVDEGRIFFVGDPKQSIYRFRRADITLFLEARERFGPDGTWARLTTNFRTVTPILDWVNEFFADTMSQELPGMQPRYERLDPWRQADSAGDHRPVLLGGPHDDPRVKADVLREAEAADVALAIAHIRNHPDQWPVEGKARGSWRPARLSDVTVLTPTRTSVPYLRDALERAGLPYRLATGTLVYDTQEVRDTLAALRAIDDPTDELSLVAALRSPLYACSDVDLFTFRQAQGIWDLRTEPPTSLGAEHRVSAAMAHLQSLWHERWWLTPSALLERLLRERQAFLLGFGDPRPTEVWRRLRFLTDQARAFEEANGGDLRAFLDWAALQSADGARVHEPLLPETDDDAVQIMTIHGSKGLEFPITILSGMTTTPTGGRRGISLLWDECGPELSLRKGIATANHEPRADLEAEMDVHEKLRLLYVAATRARDHLIVSAHHKAPAPGSTGNVPETYAKRIWTFFADRPELWRTMPHDPTDPTGAAEVDHVPGQVDGRDQAEEPDQVGRSSIAAHAPSSATDDARQSWIDDRTRLLGSQAEPRVLSATAVARASTQIDLADDHNAADADQDEPSNVPARRRGRAGTAVGRAVHATLQVLDLAAPAAIDAQVLRQCEAESIPELADTVVRLVRSALDSDTVQLAATSPHHREIYVAAPVGNRAVEGYIDLLIETDEGLIVVDYKTDAVSSEAAIDAKLAAYELQGASYAVALQAATGLTVTECRFVFCRSTGAVERSVSGEALAQATRKVAEVLGV